ncbi:MAG: transposase [Candidatus Methylomirabilales bacterium]
MGRPLRIHVPGAFYHVISRGNQGQAIFKSDHDRQTCLRLLAETWRGHAFRLYAFVLMGNHIHLVLEVGASPLAKIMQTLQYRHTRYFNKTYQTRGHLFQGRYKAILCDKDAYLLELVRYVHLNPVRAKLVKRPEQYPWSSHGAYLGQAALAYVETEGVLGQFGGARGEAVRRYAAYIHETLDQGHRQDLYTVIDQRFLGGEEFVAAMRMPNPSLGTAPIVEVPLGEIGKAVCERLGLARTSLLLRSKEREITLAKRLTALLALEVAGYSQREVAAYLGLEATSLSRGLGALREQMARNEGLKKLVDDLGRHLRHGRKPKWSKSHA